MRFCLHDSGKWGYWSTTGRRPPATSSTNAGEGHTAGRIRAQGPDESLVHRHGPARLGWTKMAIPPAISTSTTTSPCAGRTTTRWESAPTTSGSCSASATEVHALASQACPGRAPDEKAPARPSGLMHRCRPASGVLGLAFSVLGRRYPGLVEQRLPPARSCGIVVRHPRYPQGSGARR